MNDIYVVGHKNPDTDSVCAAYAYAYLKNIIDKDNNYASVRCGNLNKQTAFVFKNLNITPPKLIKDIYPKVKDMMTKEVISVHENEPLFEIMSKIKTNNIRLVPVIDELKNYKGIVSVFEISNFFMNTINSKPFYNLGIRNLEDVLPGYLYKIGSDSFSLSQLIVGAMPFEAFKDYVSDVDFTKVFLIVGKREKIIKYAIDNQANTIVLTGIRDKSELESIDFSKFHGNVYVSYLDTSETLHRITLSVPAYSLANNHAQCVSSSEYLDIARELLLESSNRALSVVDDNKLQGIITRSDVIKKYANKLILVDHNEMSQAIDGIETAQILEIIDHHRLSPIKTTYPIFFYAKPVGSTCTLVLELFKFHKAEITFDIATILLSGIISDTLGGKSPTTTQSDLDAMKDLAKVANIDINNYIKLLFSQTDDISSKEPSKLLESDLKLYEEFGVKFAIAQIETTNLDEVNQIKQVLLEEIDKHKINNKVDWIMLLVSDITKGDSILLTSDYHFEKKFVYKKIEDRVYSLPNVLSRKKQLLPDILNLLEDQTK